jgi:DNA modification methylase
MTDGAEHPTQKPMKLMSWCIQLAGETNTILDPFMGSGTTLRAAADLGRKAIGIELEERYCEVAAKRMCQTVLPLTDNNSHDRFTIGGNHGSQTDGRNEEKNLFSQ